MIGNKKIYLFCIIYLCLNVISYANLSINSSVDRNEISINESLEYKITISGAQSSISIDESFLKDFIIIRRSSSQSYKLINNEFSASQIKLFILRPQKSGIITIPSATITVEKKSLKTTPIKIKVTDIQQTAPPAKTQQKISKTQANNININQKNSDLFILANTNKQQAYVGEEVVYSVKLYRRFSTIDKLYFQEPKFQVLSEVLERDPNTYNQKVKNKNYYVQEVSRKSLFFYEKGNTLVPEATAEVQISFFYGSQIIKSNNLNLSILPLPEKNKPKNFSGLVGDYKIKSQVNTNVIIQNKPISIKITVSGNGNLKQLSELSFKETPNFKIYQSSVNDQITYTNSISGSRQFEYIVVPKINGELMFPEFNFSYFSPKAKSYVQLKTDSTKINILKSEQVNTTAITSTTKIKQLQEDLRYIKPINLSNETSNKFFYLLIISLMTIYNLIILSIILFKLLKNTQIIKLISSKLKIKANKKALTKLNTLTTQNPENLTQNIQSILYEFLSSVIKKQAQSLPNHNLFEELKRKNISEETLNKLNTLLETLSFISYSPSNSQDHSADNLISTTKDIIKRISK